MKELTIEEALEDPCVKIMLGEEATELLKKKLKESKDESKRHGQL